MAQQKRLEKHLGSLKSSFNDWQRYREKIALEDLQQDRDIQNMVFHAMLVTIQSCIDIANQIISIRKLKKPETYREVFEILVEDHIISNDLGQSMADLASFRNVLTHIYWRIDLEQTYHILKNDNLSIKEYIKILQKIVNDMTK